jgi:DNA repair exonuclease SbcCD nuclease subunit
MKFVHSADWQLGARFAQFGAKSEVLRQARLQALNTALHAAQNRGVDAFLVAGDLFEDAQVDDALIEAALAVFGRFPDVRVLLLPGNHDPNSGPSAVWQRRPFARKPDNVTVLLEPQVWEVGGATLIAAPLNQKRSTVDPSLKLAELAQAVPADRVRIGITHGALAIPGKHQPNDFPIALDAASRAGLDYLAVGHWHSWQLYDHDRLLMPGTPEPDDFGQDSGGVALVEVTVRGAPPRIERLPVATLQWRESGFDFLELNAARAALEQQLDASRELADRLVLRVTLTGSVSPQIFDETRQWLGAKLQPFPAELQALQQQHPLLAQTLGDLAQLQHLATNAPLPADFDPATLIGLPEAQALLADAKIDLRQLDAAFFKLAQQLLTAKLREAQG